MTDTDPTTPEPDACRFVRDEYAEPAPFGSCATHRRALATPDATSCPPEPDATVTALDLDAIEGRARYALEWGDSANKEMILALVAEVERMTRESTTQHEGWRKAAGRKDRKRRYWKARADEAEAKVARVREAHFPVEMEGPEEDIDGRPLPGGLRHRLACETCVNGTDDNGWPHHEPWPCPTIAALDGGQR